MDDRIRLRQICIVVDRLEPVLDRLLEVFGLQICHGKGDLSRYGVPHHEPPAYQAAFFARHGITGALLPVGETFLEVIAPLRPEVPAARYLARRGAGGYMVITEVDDTERHRRYAEASGVRIAGSADYPTYHEIQLDPRDVGGAILSFSMQREGRPFDGGWFPAGADWRRRAAPGWRGIVGATLAVKDPAAVAARWSSMTGRSLQPAADEPRLPLENATIAFRSSSGAADRLVAIDVSGERFAAALQRAAADERTDDGAGIRIGGLQFREARP